MKLIVQCFNRIKNGNMIAGNAQLNDKNDLIEYWKLFGDNLKKHIKLHEYAYCAIKEIESTGNVFWLDDTDIVFDNMYNEIELLKNEIETYLQDIQKRFPNQHKVISDYINKSHIIFKSMENSRLGLGNIMFPDSYPELINELKKMYDMVAFECGA